MKTRKASKKIGHVKLVKKEGTQEAKGRRNAGTQGTLVRKARRHMRHVI